MQRTTSRIIEGVSWLRYNLWREKSDRITSFAHARHRKGKREQKITKYITKRKNKPIMTTVSTLHTYLVSLHERNSQTCALILSPSRGHVYRLITTLHHRHLHRRMKSYCCCEVHHGRLVHRWWRAVPNRANCGLGRMASTWGITHSE